MKIGFLLLLVWGVKGGVEETVERSAKSTGSHDQIQDEILKAMKDSGVLGEMKDKLDDLLYEGNEVDTDGKAKNFLTKQEENMISAFVDEYTADKKIKVKSSMIVDIVRRVQKTPSPNLPQIFVQLTPLIDAVSAISRKSDKLESIIERQSPVFDSPAKTKDILHTLTENLKSELVRLTIDEPQKAKTVPPPPKKQKKKEKSGLDMNDYLTLGSTLLKGGNAGQILSFLSGDTDMSSMLTLLPQLMESGNSKDILSKMVFGYLENTQYGPIIKKFMDGFLKSDQGKSVMSTGYQYFEVFVKSESGRRLAKVLPKLTTATDLETFLELVHEEAEWNWAQVFENIENADYKEKSLEQLSSYLVQAYEYVTNPPKGSTIAKMPILVNGFLISNSIPPFDSKKPTESIIKIINKSMKLFTTMKMDVTPYVNAVADGLAKAFSRQAKGNKLKDLNTTQRKHLLARLLDTEFVEPMQSVWSVYTHSVNNLDCGEHLLCQVNYHERQNGLDSRIAVVKASSLAAGWALSHVKSRAGEQYWNKYKEAIFSGGKGEDCMSIYKVNDKTCNIFSWQDNNFMSTSYDHIEL